MQTELVQVLCQIVREVQPEFELTTMDNGRKPQMHTSSIDDALFGPQTVFCEHFSGWLVGWLVGWLAGWLLSWLAAQRLML